MLQYLSLWRRLHVVSHFLVVSELRDLRNATTSIGEAVDAWIGYCGGGTFWPVLVYLVCSFGVRHKCL